MWKKSIFPFLGLIPENTGNLCVMKKFKMENENYVIFNISVIFIV